MAREDDDVHMLEGVSPAYLQSLYARYSSDPASVEPHWQRWFEGAAQMVSGPSWQRSNWPPSDTDALTAGLDPTQAAIDKPTPTR